MAKRRREKMSEGKKNIIAGLIREYDNKADIIEDIYGFEVSESMVAAVTNKILP